MSSNTEIKQLMVNKPSLDQIEYDEVVNSIEKEYAQEYYFPTSKLSKTEIGFILEIDRTVLKNMNILTLSFMTNIKNPTVKSMINDLYGSNYNIVIGGHVIYTSILEKDKNIFPDAKVYPFNSTKYHNVIINIYCKPKLLSFLSTQSHVYLCSKINHVVLNPDTQKRLNDKSTSVSVPFTDDNFLIFSDGCAALKYSKCPEKNMVPTTPNFIKEFPGREFMSGKHKCYRINEGVYKQTDITSLLKVIVSGYDVVIQKVTDVPVNIKYFTKTDSTYTFTHTFIRVCDAISNISIKFANDQDGMALKNVKIKDAKIIVYGHYVDDTGYLEQREINIVPTFDDLTKEFKLDLPDKNQFIPMVTYGTTLTFNVDTKDPYAYYIMTNTTLSYDVLIATSNNDLRQSIIHTMDNFVLEENVVVKEEPSMINKLFKMFS